MHFASIPYQRLIHALHVVLEFGVLGEIRLNLLRVNYLTSFTLIILLYFMLIPVAKASLPPGQVWSETLIQHLY